MVAPPVLRVAGAALAWALTTLLVALALALVALHASHWRSLVVLTGSMEPTLSPGDLVVVSPERATSIRPGDVITFARPQHRGETLTHRVVQVRSASVALPGRLAVVTRGDANRTTERWTIPRDGTVGRLRAHVPGLGMLVRPVNGGVSRGIATAAISVLLAAVALWAIWRPARKASA